REIDELVEAVAKLSTSELLPTEFYAQLMDRIVPALAAVGGAVWTGSPGGGVDLEYQINLPQTIFGESPAGRRRHAQLVEQVLNTGKARLVPPKSGPTDSQQGANPSDFALVLGPWRLGEASAGVVEVFQRPGASPSAQQGYLRFVTVICELVTDFHRNLQLRGLRQRIEQFGRFERFSERVHGSLNLTTTAYQIANEGRGFIGCDRVSVAVIRGSKCRLLAISGVDRFDRRANVVRQLERLSKAVTAIGEPLWYTGAADELPPEIEKPLNAYVDESHVRTLVILPLKTPQGEELAEQPKVLGTLVVERFLGGLDERLRGAITAVRGHSELALLNAMEVQGAPLLGLMRALGKARWFVRAKHLGKTGIALLGVAAVATALTTVPADFAIEARGELQPLKRRDIFAPSAGVISDLRVQHAEQVRADQVLLVMREPELDFEFKRVWGELQTARKKLVAAEAERLQNPRESAEERRRHSQLTAREEELRESISSLQEQYEILEQQQSELMVRSPMDGEVLTWDLKQLLEARPVSRGQILLTVADRQGPWVLELRIPDDRIAPVLAAQQESGDNLDVSFVLATDPGVKLRGTIDRVGIRTEVNNTEGAFVLATADINRDEIPELVPGGTVVAKVHCGRRPIGYVWFHDLWEAVQSWVLF
ncbi:MAG: hypothetical protein A2V98_06420, partial [Planctomycetes bacterium RBG_16_64_12]